MGQEIRYIPAVSIYHSLVCYHRVWCCLWVECIEGVTIMNGGVDLACRLSYWAACSSGMYAIWLIQHSMLAYAIVHCVLTNCWVDSRTCFHIRRHAKHQQNQGSNLLGTGSPIPTLPSTYSVHDFHSYGYHGTGVTPGLHFHLAASINAETGELYDSEITFGFVSHCKYLYRAGSSLGSW